MVSEVTIQQVRSNSDIVSIVSERISLKRSGVNYVGCCPFHAESTPSFNVNTARQIYKCFGCGKGGDVISFVQEHDRMSFTEAIEHIAAKSNIAVEYEKEYSATELQEKKERKYEIEKMLAYAEHRFHRELMEQPKTAGVWQWMNARGITTEMAIAWRLGYSPDQWNFLSTSLIERGWYQVAIDLGLMKTSQMKNFDTYRNRLIIPSYNRHQQLNGFVGRLVSGDGPKYINPSQSEVYDKSAEVFGLSQAAPAIKEKDFSYMVEGNLDVLMLHTNGIENVIAPGGTSLTKEQVKMISRYTKHIVLIPDGDTAGLEAAEKQIDLLIDNDFRVEVVELPWGEDPDSFLRNSH